MLVLDLRKPRIPRKLQVLVRRKDGRRKGGGGVLGVRCVGSD